MIDIKLKTNPSLRDCQDYVNKVLDERGLGDHGVAQIFVKLIEEIGELAAAAAPVAGLKTSKPKKNLDELEGEAADVLIVFIDLCNKLEIDLEKAVVGKESKNIRRKWQ